MGRPKGSKNKGFFFRKGRGWYARYQGKAEPLTSDGIHLRDPRRKLADLNIAYHAWLAQKKDQAPKSSGPTVDEICALYLDDAKANGAKRTYDMRRGTLFDFCSGYPAGQRNKAKRSGRLHPGFGTLLAADVTRKNVNQWLNSHKWVKCKRIKLQCLKRVFNFAVNLGELTENPIKGVKVAPGESRVTYLTPPQEAALKKHGKPDLAEAITVLIRTGARPGCEFSVLEARHVRDYGDKMEWVFPAKESKTRRIRTIRISDPEVIAIVRKKMKNKGPIFRKWDGKPWLRENLSSRFRCAIKALRQQGVNFDADMCLYALRHTYAKRILQGFWTGKQTNIETLALLMGNTPEVCRQHYLQWTESYQEPLWAAS